MFDWNTSFKLNISFVSALLMEIGCCVFVVMGKMEYLGYSYYLTVVASLLLMVTGILLYCEHRQNRRPRQFTSGPSRPPPAYVSEPAQQPAVVYNPQAGYAPYGQPVQQGYSAPYPGAYPVYPQVQQQGPYPQQPPAPAPVYQPPASEHKFTDFQ